MKVQRKILATATIVTAAAAAAAVVVVVVVVIVVVVVVSVAEIAAVAKRIITGRAVLALAVGATAMSSGYGVGLKVRWNDGISDNQIVCVFWCFFCFVLFFVGFFFFWGEGGGGGGKYQ